MSPLARDDWSVRLTEKFGGRLEHHVSARDRFGFGVGGVIDYYTVATSVNELLTAVTIAQDAAIPWIIIGAGSQVIISEFGYPGLVIHNRAERIQFNENAAQVIVDSGASWHQIVLSAAAYDLGGFESLLNLPGTVGGALVNKTVDDRGVNPISFIRHVTIIDHEQRIRQLTVDALKQANLRQVVILVATLQMVRTRRDEVVRRISRYEREYRAFALHQSAWIGPVFKTEFAQADPTYLPMLFERSRVLGVRVGGAVFSRERPNFIEARGRVTASDVRELVAQVYHLLHETTTELPVVAVTFVGNWTDTETTATSRFQVQSG